MLDFKEMDDIRKEKEYKINNLSDEHYAACQKTRANYDEYFALKDKRQKAKEESIKLKDNIKPLEECEDDIDCLERLNDASYALIDWLILITKQHEIRFSAWDDYYENYVSHMTLMTMMFDYMVDYIRVVKEDNALRSVIGGFPTGDEKEKLAEFRELEEKYETFINDVILKEQAHCDESKERCLKHKDEKGFNQNMPYYDSVDSIVEGMNDILRMNVENADKTLGIRFLTDEESEDSDKK